MRKINLHFLIFFSSFIFTVKIMPSPAYILPTTIILFGFLHGTIKISLKYLILSIFLSAAVIYTAVDLWHPATLLALGSLAIIPYIKNAVNLKRLVEKSNAAYKIILIFFSFETFFRLALPKLFASSSEIVDFYLNSSSNDAFYAYKFGSFAFIDSNLVGICLVILAGLGFNLLKVGKISGIILFINILLIILTFSRSAYIGATILIASTYFDKKIVKLLTLSMVISLIIFLLINSQDESLGTKFLIYEDFFEIFIKSDIYTLLNGRGFGWFIDYHGIASHSILVQSIIEGGLVFTAIFIYNCFIYGAFSSKRDFYTFISVFIPSLSVSVYVFFPAWFITTAINSYINSRHRKVHLSGALA